MTLPIAASLSPRVTCSPLRVYTVGTGHMKAFFSARVQCVIGPYELTRDAIGEYPTLIRLFLHWWHPNLVLLCVLLVGIVLLKSDAAS